MLLIAALILAVPLVSCSPQAGTKEQAFAEGFIKTVYNMDYNTVNSDQLVAAYKKYMTKDYLDADGSMDYLNGLAADFKDSKIVRSVDTVKVVGTSKATDGSVRIGVDIIINNISGSDEELLMDPGKKYVMQAIIPIKADANGNLLATDMPLPGNPTEYDGKSPLPDYVPGLDEAKDKDAVYGVQEKYYRFLYDVDYKTITPQSGEKIYDICTQSWRDYNTISADDPSLATPTDSPTADTATPSASPAATTIASPKVSPAKDTASPSASPTEDTAPSETPGATDIPDDTAGAVTEFAQNFYDSMQSLKVVDQFQQFHPISLESTGVGEYTAKSYMVVKHVEGEGDYYTQMGIVLGQTYLYMITTDIAYEDGAWKINSEDENSVVYGGKFSGTFPADLPGTHPDTDYDACESAAKAFVSAEATVDYKAGKDKLNAHYTAMGTQNLLDTLNASGYFDKRANEFIQGQLESKFADFEMDSIDPEPDPLGGQKYYLEGQVMIEYTSATPEYLKATNITAGGQLTYVVDMVLAWRDGQWKVDDFEMSPYDDTLDNTGTDTTPTDGNTDPAASPDASAAPTN